MISCILGVRKYCGLFVKNLGLCILICVRKNTVSIRARVVPNDEACHTDVCPHGLQWDVRFGVIRDNTRDVDIILAPLSESGSAPPETPNPHVMASKPTLVRTDEPVWTSADVPFSLAAERTPSRSPRQYAQVVGTSAESHTGSSVRTSVGLDAITCGFGVPVR